MTDPAPPGREPVEVAGPESKRESAEAGELNAGKPVGGESGAGEPGAGEAGR